ncbi:hypothetical protein [Streptomyces sp. NPDC046727]
MPADKRSKGAARSAAARRPDRPDKSLTRENGESTKVIGKP